VKPEDKLRSLVEYNGLTDHNPRPPFTVICVGSNEEQGDKLDSEDDTGEVEHDSAD
jgi:hypothetical protein